MSSNYYYSCLRIQSNDSDDTSKESSDKVSQDRKSWSRAPATITQRKQQRRRRVPLFFSHVGVSRRKGEDGRYESAHEKDQSLRITIQCIGAILSTNLSR